MVSLPANTILTLMVIQKLLTRWGLGSWDGWERGNRGGGGFHLRWARSAKVSWTCLLSSRSDGVPEVREVVIWKKFLFGSDIPHEVIKARVAQNGDCRKVFLLSNIWWTPKKDLAMESLKIQLNYKQNVNLILPDWLKFPFLCNLGFWSQ